MNRPWYARRGVKHIAFWGWRIGGDASVHWRLRGGGGPKGRDLQQPPLPLFQAFSARRAGGGGNPDLNLQTPVFTNYAFLRGANKSSCATTYSRPMKTHHFRRAPLSTLGDILSFIYSENTQLL